MLSVTVRSTLLYALILLGGTCFAAELRTFERVRLVPTPWADGDSFLVRFADGTEHTVRLYGADCFEWHVTDKTDARRLSAQRRYFGITGYGGTPASSIALAKSLGETATAEVRSLLAEPFTIHTGFADGGGDGRYKRIYSFVTTSKGDDLSSTLVSEGLARAFGVYRSSPEGLARDDYRAALRDAELLAATGRRGAWAYTNWDALAEERSNQRREDAEDKIATGRTRPVQVMDLNSAARDELMRIPGIGEVIANAVIEERPYRTLDELLKVKGIGKKRLAIIRQWVTISP